LDLPGTSETSAQTQPSFIFSPKTITTPQTACSIPPPSTHAHFPSDKDFLWKFLDVPFDLRSHNKIFPLAGEAIKFHGKKRILHLFAVRIEGLIQIYNENSIFRAERNLVFIARGVKRKGNIQILIFLESET
jgi:hypothetical protein